MYDGISSTGTFVLDESLVSLPESEIDQLLAEHVEEIRHQVPPRVILNLVGVENLSNIHLGFLLVFLERAEKHGVRVGLIEYNEQVRNTQNRLSFHVLFDLL